MALRMALAALLLLAPCVPARAGDRGGEEEEGDLALEDVVVSPYRSVLDQRPGEKLVLGSDAEALPLIDDDILRAVQVHPGVSGDDFSARFSVRGGDRDETLVLLDGMELFRPFHLLDYGGALSMLAMGVLEQARLWAGAPPVSLGDALSGVLELRTRDPSGRGRLEASLDLLNAQVLADRAPFQAALRAGYIGLLMGLMESDETFEPHYWDGFARWDLLASDRDRVSAYALYGGDTNRMDLFGDDEDVRSAYHTAQSWLRWKHRLGPAASLSAWAYGGWATQDRAEGAEDRDDRHLAWAGAKAVLETDLEEGLRLALGGDLRWRAGRYRYAESDADLSVDARSEGAGGRAFLATTWRLGPFLRAELGGRVLYASETERATLGASAALSFEPAEGLVFRAGWSRCHQPAGPLRLPVETGADRSARPEEAAHWTASAQYRCRPWGLHVRVEAYYKDYPRLLGLVRDHGRKAQELLAADSGWAQGVEVSLDKTFGSAALLHAGYAWSRSRREKDGASFWSEQDQRHAFQAGLRLSPGNGWRLYAGWRCHSGRPYTRVWYEAGERRTGPLRQGRYPPYHSLDLRVSKAFTWGGTRIEVYVQVLNLYDRANVHEYVWTFSEEQGGAWVREEEHHFPLLPTLGVRVVF